MKLWITSLFLILGSLVSLLAAIGILRFPDVFTRQQAAAKGGTLGVGLLILAVAIYFFQLGVTTRALLIIIFLVLTAPVAAHMIGRAAYFIGVPMWKGSVTDDLKGHYDPVTHALDSGLPKEPESQQKSSENSA